MKRFWVLVIGVLLIAGTAYGQSGSEVKGSKQPNSAMCPLHDESSEGLPQKEQKQTEQPKEQAAMCPMMETMHGPQGAQGMKDMRQQMGGMCTLSQQEIASFLAAKKESLGLTDSQIKQVAELIAESQRPTTSRLVEGMTTTMGAGGMKCSHMESSPK